MAISLPNWLQNGFGVSPVSSNGNFNCSVIFSHNTHANYILKKVNFCRNDIALTAYENMKFLQNNKHPNIVQLIRVDVTNAQVYLLSEHMGGFNISCALRSGCLSLSIIKHVMYQVVSALEYLHEKKMIHGNLVPDNILSVNKTEYPLIKVSDCGMTLFKSQKPWTNSLHRPYHAPEVVYGAPYSPKADMWSFGIILAESILGISPTESSFSKHLSILVEREGRIFQDTLQWTPMLRCSSTTVKNHSFFKEATQKSKEDYVPAYKRQVGNKGLTAGEISSIANNSTDITDLCHSYSKFLSMSDVKNQTNGSVHFSSFKHYLNSTEEDNNCRTCQRKIVSSPGGNSLYHHCNGDYVMKYTHYQNDSGIDESGDCCRDHLEDDSHEHFIGGVFHTKNAESDTSDEFYSCEEDWTEFL